MANIVVVIGIINYLGGGHAGNERGTYEHGSEPVGIWIVSFIFICEVWLLSEGCINNFPNHEGSAAQCMNCIALGGWLLGD